MHSPDRREIFQLIKDSVESYHGELDSDITMLNKAREHIDKIRATQTFLLFGGFSEKSL